MFDAVAHAKNSLLVLFGIAGGNIFKSEADVISRSTLLAYHEQLILKAVGASVTDETADSGTPQLEENCQVNSIESKAESTGTNDSRTTSSDAPKPNPLKDMKDEEQNQLRRQIVSLGKQPKAHQGRRKKDMVCSFSIHLFELSALRNELNFCL